MTLSTQAAAVSSGNAWLCCIFSRPPSVLCKAQGVSQESLAGLTVIRERLSGPQGHDVCARPANSHTEPFMSRWDGALQPASSHRHSQHLHWQTDEWMSLLYVCMTGPSYDSPVKQTRDCWDNVVLVTSSVIYAQITLKYRSYCGDYRARHTFLLLLPWATWTFLASLCSFHSLVSDLFLFHLLKHKVQSLYFGFVNTASLFVCMCVSGC